MNIKMFDHIIRTGNYERWCALSDTGSSMQDTSLINPQKLMSYGAHIYTKKLKK